MALMPSDRLVVSEESTDAEIFLAIQLRQVNALNLLYERYSKLVYSVAIRVLNNPEESEEVTQDTFLRLWQRSEIYQYHRGSLSGFLVMLARSRSIDLLRSRKSSYQKLQRIQLLFSCLSEYSLPLEFAMIEERARLIHQAFEQLSPTAQKLLKCIYYEGISQPEIAKREGVPIGTVKSRLRLARRQLRCALNRLI